MRRVRDLLIEHLFRLMRYGAVSIIASAVGFTVLGVLVGVVNAPAGWSNVISTSIAAIPSFELNRRWSWKGRSGGPTAAQVVPFLVMTFVGLALSTWVVHLAGLMAAEQALSRNRRTVFIEGANLGTWAALWLVQYLVLDRFLFRPLARRDQLDHNGGGAGEGAAGVGGGLKALDAELLEDPVIEAEEIVSSAERRLLDDAPPPQESEPA